MKLQILLISLSAALMAQGEPLKLSISENAHNVRTLQVKNESASAITSLCIRTDITNSGRMRGSSFLYFDSLVNVSKDSKILPAETRTFTFTSNKQANAVSNSDQYVHGGIAALFADGTTYGDPILVAILKGRREVVLNELKRYLPHLDSLSKSTSRATDVVSILNADLANFKSSAPPAKPVDDESRILQATYLARGFITRLISLSIDSIEKSPCPTDPINCHGRQFSNLKVRFENWRTQLETSSTTLSQ